MGASGHSHTPKQENLAPPTWYQDKRTLSCALQSIHVVKKMTFWGSCLMRNILPSFAPYLGTITEKSLLTHGMLVWFNLTSTLYLWQARFSHISFISFGYFNLYSKLLSFWGEWGVTKVWQDIIFGGRGLGPLLALPPWFLCPTSRLDVVSLLKDCILQASNHKMCWIVASMRVFKDYRTQNAIYQNWHWW